MWYFLFVDVLNWLCVQDDDMCGLVDFGDGGEGEWFCDQCDVCLFEVDVWVDLFVVLFVEFLVIGWGDLVWVEDKVYWWFLLGFVCAELLFIVLFECMIEFWEVFDVVFDMFDFLVKMLCEGLVFFDEHFE